MGSFSQPTLAPVQPSKGLHILVDYKPSPNNREVFLCLSLKSHNNRRQSFRLWQGVPVPYSPGNVATGGSQTFGAQSGSVGSRRLDPSTARTPDQGAVTQCQGCSLYQHSGTRSHATLGKASQVISWTETHCPLISTVQTSSI